MSQQDGSNLVFIAHVPAHNQTQLPLIAGSPPRVSNRLLSLAAVQNSLKLTCSGKPIGELAWDIVVEPAKKRSGDDNLCTKQDFAKEFQPLPLSFRKSGTGPVFDTWHAETSKSGLHLAIDLRAYHEGFLDWTAHIVNESASSSNVYAAVICRWRHPQLSNRTLCYDNRRTAFGGIASTSFRGEEGRHWHMGHGVDWVRTRFQAGPNVVWLNPFNPSFTIRAEATSKTPAHYTGGNQAQLAHEAQSVSSAFFSITEIARPTIKSLRDRFRENVLPPKGEHFEFTSRLIFSRKNLTDDAADEMFVGYTGYREQRLASGTGEITFGVRSVRFGTSYFPYSTLGENFDGLALPGMDRDAFWPLAADTVNQWQLFADDIRRDLRLAKWMGFKLIRLHHLELLAPIEKNVRQQYLDFLFGELRHLQLKALVDVYASPEQITELLQRYGDAIDTIEVENEVLIWGIPLDRPQYWKEIYQAVKRTAPHVLVHWTAQNNTGIFDRLTQLGVPFDRVGLHSYVDSLDAIPSARGWALSAANYGSQIGKPPVITEWNWRHLTRMTPESRAKVYPQIIEGAVGTRSIPDFYQFQLNETLAPNLRVGRGNILRHYELLNLSRHPKADAIELTRIIQRYAAPEDVLRQIGIGYAVTVLDENGKASVSVAVTNLTSKPVEITISTEAPRNLRAQIRDNRVALRAHQSKKILVSIETKETQPGFYHCFLRLEGSANSVRYAAIECRLPGKPAMDLERASKVHYPRGIADELQFAFEKVAAVVYGVDAPVLEVETAFAIAQTLESATGRLIPLYQLNDLPRPMKTANLIVVGTSKSNPLANATPGQTSSVVTRASNGKQGEWLIVAGSNSEAVEKAGMDLVLRYWIHAKDSAARRVGLIEKQLPRGIDPTKLP